MFSGIYCFKCFDGRKQHLTQGKTEVHSKSHGFDSDLVSYFKQNNPGIGETTLRYILV